MTQCCAKDKICIVQQPKRDFLPNLVLAFYVFLHLIIAQCYVYNEIQGGVEFSPLRNYRKRENPRWPPFPRSNNKLMPFFYVIEADS